MLTIAELEAHVAYSAWASRRLVEAAARLSEAERTRDFGTADKSILGTLAHIYAADRVWLGRVTGNPPARFFDPEQDLTRRAVEVEWPKVLDGWKAFLAAAPGVDVTFSYRDLKGNAYTTPLWQIVLHLVNHATHHRGQVSGFLRSLGHVPPPVDLIFYHRSL